MAVRKAEAQLAGGLIREELERRVGKLQADRVMLETLQEIRLTQSDIKDGNFDVAGSDTAYARAFREYGIDVTALEPEKAAALVRGREIAVHLAAGLDDWAMAVWRVDKAKSMRLLGVARAADPDAWRTSLREALTSEDAEKLSKLAASAPVEKLPAPTLALVGRIFFRDKDGFQFATGILFRDKDGLQFASGMLRRAHRRFPADFWINHELAFALSHQGRPLLQEGIGFYRAAAALRPGSPAVRVNLGNALKADGQLDAAIEEYREAVRLEPNFAAARINLGDALRDKRQLDEAIAEYREAIRLKPNYPEAHNNLGIALAHKGQLDEAIREFREAIRFKPEHAAAHTNLGNVLRAKGRLDEAISEHRESVRLKQDSAEAHVNLGAALWEDGQPDEAISSYREAIRLKPNYPEAHNNLGIALAHKGQLDEAIQEFRQAIRLKTGLRRGPQQRRERPPY
jgi:tetratricopeptide (TPR) repeat protein